MPTNQSALTESLVLDLQVWPRPRSMVTYRQAQAHLIGIGNTGSFGHPKVFTPQTVGGEIAFQALLLDGTLDLERPGVAVYPDEAPTPLLRAQTCAIPPGLNVVLGRRTAAWVHTGKFPPRVIDVLYPQTSFICALPSPAQFARSNVPSSESVNFGTTRVTSPVRTVVDLAAWCTASEATKHIFGFSEPQRLMAEACAYLADHAGFRNKIPALELLSRLLDRTNSKVVE